jgi:hypothetical protein
MDNGTFQKHRKTAIHLVPITMSMSDRKKIQIYLRKHSRINEALQISKEEPIFAFSDSPTYTNTTSQKFIIKTIHIYVGINHVCKSYLAVLSNCRYNTLGKRFFGIPKDLSP